MDKRDWIDNVRKTIAENPNWITDTQIAITQGINDRLNKETTARVNAETALIICYEAKNGIPEHQVDLVKNAVRNCLMIAGTPYSAAV